MLPKSSDMFDSDNAVDVTNKFEEFKSALSKSLDAPRPVGPNGPFSGGEAAQSPVAALQASLDNPDISKALGSDVVESVRTQMAQSELNKDWTLGNPVSTGLYLYDLEAPAKLLAPRPTPLRNRIARRKGQGNAHQFKTITGLTGTGTGGVGLIRPGITETTQNTFGGVSYLRGPKISYAGIDTTVPYKQFSVSDQVSWAAQFAGQGFDDLRQLSKTSVLYSSMLLEERMLLGGRGTSSGFVGALAAPTGLSLAVRTAASNEIGNTANIANLFVRVTSVGIWGESVSSAEATSTGLSAVTGKVIDITLVDAPGALAYKVYVGTTTGAANCFAGAISNSSATLNVAPQAAGSQVGGAPITVHFTGAGTGGAPNAGATAPVADTSASANDYDGILSYCTGTNAGYVKRINNTFAGADGANVANTFEVAFSSMYDSVKADPDEILANGNDRKQVSDQLKTQSSANYQIQVMNASGPESVHDATIGSLVTGIANPISGKSVKLTVHPWLPQGTMPIISWTLPMPDSNISDTFAVYNVVDYQAVDWPVTQFAYETSSYWQGSLVGYAPGWCGAIQGIFRA